VQEKFAEVVDRIGDECSNGEVVGARLAFFGCKIIDGNACKVEEGIFVIGGEFLFGLEGIS
jgi:hypothetical protein